MSLRHSWSFLVLAALAITACTAGRVNLTAGDSPPAVASSHDKPFPVQKTDAEWRRILSPEAYEVLRHADTEKAWTSPLLNEHRKGTFVCAACGYKLFDSDTKFDSGTGWPSFFRALKGEVIEQPDYSDGTERTEVICAHCGSHLGHVFSDGPQPTGLRYCMNGVALKFVPYKAPKPAGTPVKPHASPPTGP